MEKIPTLFKRSTQDPSLVTPEVNPDAAWLFEEGGIPTVKKDGTNICVEVIAGEVAGVAKRKNPSRKEKALAVREGKPKPEPTYVTADRDDPADKHIFAAVDATDFSEWPAGAWPCEALGPKIQGGVESDVPCLYPFTLWPERLHGLEAVLNACGINYHFLMEYLAAAPIEGIVWHGKDGKMCKLKRRDFSYPWPIKG